MKAAFYEKTGPAHDVLQVGEMPTPEPARGEVRVKLRFSGVNPSDVKSRMGLRSSAPAFARIVPHSDGMGVIDAVGEGVDRARIGERVWIWNGAWGRAFGTAAEFMSLPQEQAVAMPEGTPDEAGACFGIPALTAMHAVLMSGGVQGKRVLVQGGAGAVGHYAVQFARELGASQVIATVSSEAKAQLAREAGAQVVIDYKREDVAAAVMRATNNAGVERVIEVDIAANAAVDAQCVRTGGEWVVYGSGKSPFPLEFFPLISKNIELRFFIVYNLDREQRASAIDTLHRLIRKGSVRHNVSHRLPLSRIADAHDMVAAGTAGGNVVLSIEG
ncbi:MAG TPA: NADPH:quinone reductase [Ramlibacter sp.]|nr:NADPH:quinone reductase [Ramlibacter sp.]